MKLIICLFVACVLIVLTQQQLMPTCSDPNEIYIPCKNHCIRDTCEHAGMPISCFNILPCNGGCICQFGFMRKNESAPCMPLANCFI